MHDLLLMVLRYLQDSLLGPRVEALLHLVIDILNSSLKKGIQWVTILFGTSSNKSVLTYQYCAELNDLWRACQRSSSSKQGHLLYLIALIAGIFLFLIQFMSSQGPLQFSRFLCWKILVWSSWPYFWKFSSLPNVLTIYTSLVLSNIYCSTTILNIWWCWQFLSVWTKFHLYYMWILILLVQDFSC